MVRVSVIDLHGLVNHWTSAERDKPSLGDFAGLGLLGDGVLLGLAAGSEP